MENSAAALRQGISLFSSVILRLDAISKLSVVSNKVMIPTYDDGLLSLASIENLLQQRIQHRCLIHIDVINWDGL